MGDKNQHQHNRKYVVCECCSRWLYEDKAKLKGSCLCGASFCHTKHNQGTSPQGKGGLWSTQGQQTKTLQAMVGALTQEQHEIFKLDFPTLLDCFQQPKAKTLQDDFKVAAKES
eukprot:5207531-Heterocapsa_arctica.AAC.1